MPSTHTHMLFPAVAPDPGALPPPHAAGARIREVRGPVDGPGAGEAGGFCIARMVGSEELPSFAFSRSRSLRSPRRPLATRTLRAATSDALLSSQWPRAVASLSCTTRTHTRHQPPLPRQARRIAEATRMQLFQESVLRLEKSMEVGVVVAPLALTKCSGSGAQLELRCPVPACVFSQ